jgi:hypothetical protein
MARMAVLGNFWSGFWVWFSACRARECPGSGAEGIFSSTGSRLWQAVYLADLLLTDGG